MSVKQVEDILGTDWVRKTASMIEVSTRDLDRILNKLHLINTGTEQDLVFQEHLNDLADIRNTLTAAAEILSFG